MLAILAVSMFLSGGCGHVRDLTYRELELDVYFGYPWEQGDSIQLIARPVPEPGTLAMLGAGIAAMFGLTWLRRPS